MKNTEIAIKALNEARKDHYDGVNAIYRLAACVPIVDGTSPKGVRKQINRLKKELSTLKVQANRINVYDDMLEIDYYPKGFQMVMTRGQYTGLHLELAEFLDTSNIPNIYIQYGCFEDDPEEGVKPVSNDLVNFFPEFNSKCFGANENEPIEIINCCFNERFEEVA